MAAMRRWLWLRRAALACTIAGALVWATSWCTLLSRDGLRLDVSLGAGDLTLVWDNEILFLITEVVNASRLSGGAEMKGCWLAIETQPLGAKWSFDLPRWSLLTRRDFWSWQWLGVGVPRRTVSLAKRGSEANLRIPTTWFVILPGAVTILLFWRTRRLPAGLCQSCGYDLTGNTTGICPECGTPCPDSVATSPPPQEIA